MEPIRVLCPNCGKAYRISPQQVGKRAKCKACGESFVAEPGEPEQDSVESSTTYEGSPTSSGEADTFNWAALASTETNYQSPGGYAPAPNYGPPPVGGKQKNPIAVVALVFSCLVCIPLASVVALVLGIIGLLRSKKRGGAGEGLSIASIIVGGIFTLGLPLLISILLPSLNRARETANRIKCASNERVIGQALAIYAQSHNNQYPPDLNTLVKTGIMGTEYLVCPDDSDTTVDSNRPEGSYIFLAGNANASSIPPQQVILYEPLTEHVDGSNVLCGDMHVVYVPKNGLAQVVPSAVGSVAQTPQPQDSPDASQFPQGPPPGNPRPRPRRPGTFRQTDPRYALTPPSPEDQAQELQNIAGMWHHQGNAVDLLPAMKGNAETDADGVVTLSPNQRIITPKSYHPTVTYQIVMMTNVNDTRIGYAADEIIFNWEVDPNQLRVGGGPASGKHKMGVGQLPPNQWVAVEFTVTPKAMIIDVNGEEIYNVEADFSLINQPMSLTAHNGSVKLQSVKVIAE